MSLALSSGAAPELSLAALDLAVRARGLDGVELVLGAEASPEACAAEARAAGAKVVALRVERLPGDLAALVRAAATLGAPISAPAEAVPAGALAGIAAAFDRGGARLLLSQGATLGPMVALVQALHASSAPPCVGIAWELRPASESLEEASAALFAARERLGLVRLHGGGPEQSEQDGLGIGGVLADLTACDYSGPIVLTPSSPAAQPRWREWLFSKRISGCGSKHEPRSLQLDLDVRPVEPRDRLETILGAYHALARGGTLRLTVDHDPSCMYFTLQATEPEGSFSFNKLEDGPEVWRAEVTRL